jgi:tetratricopeptide (TPR) repeat protein
MQAQAPGPDGTLGQEANRLRQEGDRLRQARDYETALDRYETALALYREAVAAEDEGKTLYRMGLAYVGLREFARALEHY